MYKIDDIIKCVVTGFKDYGIFVKVDETFDGLIHISEVSESFVRSVTDYCDVGEEIAARVIGVDNDNHQLKLSIKNIDYKGDGRSISEADNNGFMPLKKHLNIWINEKIKEMNKF